MSYLVYKHLTREDRIVENVTEWAKRETSWDWAKEIGFNYDADFINQLVNKKYVSTQEYSALRIWV